MEGANDFGLVMEWCGKVLGDLRASLIGIVCTKPWARVGPLCVFARGGRFDVAYGDDASIEREVKFS